MKLLVGVCPWMSQIRFCIAITREISSDFLILLAGQRPKSKNWPGLFLEGPQVKEIGRSAQLASFYTNPAGPLALRLLFS